MVIFCYFRHFCPWKSTKNENFKNPLFSALDTKYLKTLTQFEAKLVTKQLKNVVDVEKNMHFLGKNADFLLFSKKTWILIDFLGKRDKKSWILWKFSYILQEQHLVHISGPNYSARASFWEDMWHFKYIPLIKGIFFIVFWNFRVNWCYHVNFETSDLCDGSRFFNSVKSFWTSICSISTYGKKRRI